MAIKLPQGLYITSNEPVDARIVLSKNEMLNTIDATMPQVYLAVCKNDGQLYLYNKENPINESTGRFRLYSSGSITPEELALELPKALKKNLEEQKDDSGLIVDSEGNIKLNINEEHLKLDNNTLDIQEGMLLQAIESN